MLASLLFYYAVAAGVYGTLVFAATNATLPDPTSSSQNATIDKLRVVVASKDEFYAWFGVVVFLNSVIVIYDILATWRVLPTREASTKVSEMKAKVAGADMALKGYEESAKKSKLACGADDPIPGAKEAVETAKRDLKAARKEEEKSLNDNTLRAYYATAQKTVERSLVFVGAVLFAPLTELPVMRTVFSFCLLQWSADMLQRYFHIEVESE